MAFYFPSLSAVVKGTLGTFKRFPLSLLSGITASSICIFMIGLKGDEEKLYEHLGKIVMCCWLGLTLFLSLSQISERRGHNLLQKYIPQLLGLLALVAYYFLLPEFKSMTVTEITRFALFGVGLHLLVSFSPFIGTGDVNGFWQFNKTLFLRFLLSGLYSAVLFIGLALALAAINMLFDVKIKEERFGQLWFFLAGIFNTWFFLSGVPKNFGELEAETDYPKGLQVFTQFVLLPLITIYLIILYAYGVKIMINWKLPNGWVSWMVNAFSVFGILSLLLIYPIRNNENNKWINIFSKWFYRALFPLIFLLGAAIGKRVYEYGVTENRYFILVVALWLTGIAVYFLVSKRQNIKLIPISLFFVVFLSSFGPWGAFSVSERSQVNRLERILAEEKILVEGKVKKADTVSRKNGRHIISIVHYLDDHHGFDAVKPWFKDLDTVLASKDSKERADEAGKILELLGVEDRNYYYREDENEVMAAEEVKTFYYSTFDEHNSAIALTNFDYLFYLNESFEDENRPVPANSSSLMHFGQDSGSVEYSRERKAFTFAKNGKVILEFDLVDFVKKITASNKEMGISADDRNVPAERMILEAKNDSVSVKLYINSIAGTMPADSVAVEHIDASMLMKIAQPKNPNHAGAKAN